MRWQRFNEQVFWRILFHSFVCIFQDLKNEGTYVLQGWRSTQAKQTFTYTVSDKKPITFSWAFQKSFQVREIRELVRDS